MTEQQIMPHQLSASNETETVAAMLSPGASSSEMINNTSASTGILYDEKEVMEEFISCYRHFAALWDSSSSDYLSKTKKEPGYKELLKILRRINGDCTVQDVKRKINSLRCCYRRVLKKMQSSKYNYRPRLWWFNQMEFLKPVLNIGSPPRANNNDDHHMDDSLDETSINDEDMFAEAFDTETDALGDPEPEPDQDPEMIAADQTPIMLVPLTLKTEEHSQSHSRDYQTLSPQSMTSNANGLYSYCPPKHRHGAGSGSGRPPLPAGGMMERAGRPVRRRSSTSHDDEYFQFVDGEPSSAKQRRVESSYDHAESECVLIGKRMAAHFRNMRPDQRLFAERIISEVLVYGRMNQLSMRARFVPNVKDGAASP
ncbi:uncharacterized protein LOC108165467 isoform X4 [Drosophila miranda]|uniref:uncharacterized protein LOC108165467 isoform X4 n=1 Tax=Drosophila miranda TaxID=7229 RepID=UPI00143F54E9|nr:uncharacterized protein LOC108165467 isoform X4 [Drosophila miranda]